MSYGTIRINKIKRELEELHNEKGKATDYLFNAFMRIGM